MVGYLDHSYFIAPGRGLEGDLTDMETNHLAQDYLIPSMKAELPDSGMLYLARGVYALMEGKEMPRMAALSAQESDDSDGTSDTLWLIIYASLLTALLIYSAHKSHKLGWAGLSYPMFIAANPFHINEGSSGGGSWGGGSSHSSGGGFSSGGGYGGGSWGGGGSGGRW